MYSMVMVATMLIGQQQQLQRDAFRMIAGMEALQAAPAQPANRLVKDIELRNKVIDKAKSLATKHAGNSRDLQLRITSKKLTDWLYGLPEVRGALIQPEIEELNKIVVQQIDNVIKQSKPVVPSTKEWFWFTYRGYNLPIYGWKNTSGQYQYYIHEQTPQVQTILLGR